jgi:hypothetical protein
MTSLLMMETRSGLQYGELHEVWQNEILWIANSTETCLGPIVTGDPASKALLQDRLMELKSVVKLSRELRFWNGTLPDLMDRIRDQLCETGEVWALWKVRTFCYLSESLRIAYGRRR